MHHQAPGRVQGTDDDVESDPCYQKPARPIAAAEHKHSAKNRENPDEANPDQPIFTLRFSLTSAMCCGSKWYRSAKTPIAMNIQLIIVTERGRLFIAHESA